MNEFAHKTDKHKNMTQQATSLFALGLAGVAITGVGLFQGFKHGVWAACCSFALGRCFFDDVNKAPVSVARIPFGIGVTTTALSPFSEYPLGTLIYGISYTAGALMGASLLENSTNLLSVATGLVVLQVLFI
ncbi:hypothetical protein [Brazilian marseillevirus]|uniref:hypothetical protein n=1 Tax=Brazilian marseillevirus TaxID=1813599 RepID=UPI000784A43C|nr:hypothetical protein A3303_gp011 [Brazilian marseillevirus]AMQ10519.1 hypothetical protein [Brazilian marseillevirus]